MTARYAAIASAITAAVVIAMVAAIALLASDLGLGLPDGFEDLASTQYRERTGETAAIVLAAGVWADCTVVDMTRTNSYPSMIMVRNSQGWRIARLSDRFDTDDVYSDNCLAVAGGANL